MAEKFDWKATESAPEYFPMEIVRGYFHAPDGSSLYVPNKKTIHHGWGNSISSHLVGDDLKTLPKSLEITFFSYTEDQFYQGDFSLPNEEITKLFKEGYYSPKIKKEVTYFEIIAGVAPGGLVSVWVAGIDKTTEVFIGDAKKIELEWSEIIDNPEVSRHEVVEEAITYARRKVEDKSIFSKDINLDLWNTYTKRYNWQPVFDGQEPPELINRMRYFNGEDEYLYLPLNEEFTNKLHPIPKEMIFKWEWPKGRPLRFKLFFDSDETLAAFEQLGSLGQALRLKLILEKRGETTVFGVLLENDKDYVVFDKIKLENYGVPEKK